MYLDLDELPDLFRGRWFWSARRPAPGRFDRRHYLGPADRPLADCVRDAVVDAAGFRPEGPIRMLTNLSYFGYCFNPVTYYYCYDRHGERLEAIVGEVTNTPWGERRVHVLAGHNLVHGGAMPRFRDEKNLHVSPFMPMDIVYDWRFCIPGDRLSVHVAATQDNRRLFTAGLALRREPISATALNGLLIRFPLMTVRVVMAIYWQAFVLWLKGSPIHPHPRSASGSAANSPLTPT